MALRRDLGHGSSHYHEMWELVQAHPDGQRHVVDLPYRLCSPSATQRGSCIWRDTQGAVIGWAILQWQFWALDHMVAPGPHAHGVGRSILEWAIERTSVEAINWKEPLRLFVDAPIQSPPHALPLGDFGFTLYPHWRTVHLERPADLPPPPPAIPAGFTIRPLAGAQEIDAYVDTQRAAFGSSSMTRAWREEILRLPQYNGALDLVAAAPDGTLAGFCICWLNHDARWATGPEITGQVEPIAVRPEYQGRGLGRALLFEGIRRMAARGAQRMFIDADPDNVAALALDQSAGFRIHETIQKYMLAVPPAAASH